MVYSTVQYSTVQYSTVQYSTVQYSTVQYSTVQYSTVQYSTAFLLLSQNNLANKRGTIQKIKIKTTPLMYILTYAPHPSVH
jgi:hypothetical protein